MIEQTKQEIKSRRLALELYDSWIRERQGRPDFEIPKNESDLKEIRMKNFVTQLAEPRRRHLEQMKEIAPEMSAADKVALLVMLELPVVETSTLLHRLSVQLAANPEAVYFSQENMNDNCGSGCGCGCAFMENLPWEERINVHMDAKPFSIDPFNEIDMTKEEHNSLLVKDFLESFQSLSHSVSGEINQRYYQMGRSFGRL